MESGKIAIVDMGMGNLCSVKKKLDWLNINSEITSSPDFINEADKIILPGVGHFGKAIDSLKKKNLYDTINEAVKIKGKPILGICLGMQLMAQSSEEGSCAGFGWFDSQVVKFNISNYGKYKIPHIGWNQVNIKKNSVLMKEIKDGTEFYFVHSYHFIANNQDDILNATEYEYQFISAIEKENIFGVQYHPEKSHDAGSTLFKNFARI
ncbi:MAG: imidazole glycerol phosphate synthase subunit HisH [Bacteroidetes bacterium]|nr:imidazole glycerol phosphate synthase subunit HisH [Bacteroidota bacterium]